MTWYEYTCLLSGFLQRENEKWKHTRKIVHTIYAVNRTEKRLMTEAEFFPLLFEDDTSVGTEYTPQDKADMMELAESRAAQVAAFIKNKK